MPSSSDPLAARRLGKLAVADRLRVEAEAGDWAAALTDRLEAGSLPSWLHRVDGVVRGFVSWSSDCPLGLSVDLVSVDPTSSRPEEYARLLDAVERQAGPIAFLHGPFPGLSPRTEEALLRGRGFRRFSRLEMARDPSVPLPSEALGAGQRIRPVEPADLEPLTELHRDAYRGRFDRYLFLESPDETEDARREVRQILEGRWGPFALEGSRLLEHHRRPVGAVLSVWGPTGALIADVMVEPALRGKGFGQQVLAAAVRGLEAAGAAKVYLNVTSGNEPALRLYRRLGFARTLGPSQGWYNARLIPVAPSPDA